MSSLFVGSALVGGLAAPLILKPVRRVISPLIAAGPETDFSFSPTALSIGDVICIMLMLVIKSLGQTLGIWQVRPIRPTTKSLEADLEITGPRLQVSMPLRITKDDLVAFSRSIDQETVDFTKSPGQLMLFLSAVTEPAMLLLLAKKECPIKPIGSVNVENEFRALNPEKCLDLIAMRTENPTTVRASLSEGVRPMKRGFEYDLIVDILGAERDEPIFRQTFTMLQFAKHTYAPRTKAPGPSEVVASGTPSNQVSMASNDPFLWAALCKDYNPIHISKLGAKMFGMPGKIAHGNHVAAKAIASIPTDAIKFAARRDGRDSAISSMNVSFKRPTRLPAKLEVSTKIEEDQSLVLNVFSRDKITVICRLQAT